MEDIYISERQADAELQDLLGKQMLAYWRKTGRPVLQSHRFEGKRSAIIWYRRDDVMALKAKLAAG